VSAAPKVAIITGASRGIGAGLVRAYRERGFSVIATSLSISAQQDERVIAVAADIRLPETAAKLVALAKERFGRLDSLVNNAGLFISKPFTAYTQLDFDELIGVNVAGFFYLTQLAAIAMLAQRFGHIVNITAALADQPRESTPAALAMLTKGGVAAATRALATEFASHGVRVNAVAPGVVKTSMHPDATQEALARQQPIGRMTEIEDVTDAVLFLEFAPLVTGEILHVDGGSHAGRP
jgi:NAD(P)-dependent dehydrogenase (short-subunit alcohol dehydrogenase family)